MKLGRNDPCWCGSNKKYKICHEQWDAKIQKLAAEGHEVPKHEIIKTPEQIAGMRASSAINMAVLDYVAENIREGMTTEEIDQLVYNKTLELGGIPAPLHYEGFPKSVCTSINNVVCHGIPSEYETLMEGDIVNIDVSTIYNGYFSDSSRMFMIGEVDPEVQRLVQVTKECVEKGLEQVKPWGFLGDVGQAINDYAQENGYSVVEEIGGHGIGLAFHEDPWVSHVAERGDGMVMAPGMVFTIEPMVNMGDPDIYIDDEDGWTVYTDDDMPSAQWEIMVLVTETGHEVLCW